MEFLNKIIEQFIRANRKMKRWQRVVSILAAVVVFATTYALVLPAVTLDKETASEQSGIEIAASGNEPESDGTAYEAEPEEPAEEAQEEESEEPEENESEEPQDAEAVTEDSGSRSGSQDAEVSEEDDSYEDTEADGGQNTEEQTGSRQEEAPVDDEAPAPDTEENGTATDPAAATALDGETAEEIKLITEDTQLIYEYVDEEYEDGIDDENEDGIDDGYFVYAEFGADAKLPEGVELIAEEITKESDPETYEAYYEKALSGLQDKYDENTALSFARFYDIKFVYNGKEVEPSGDVKVRIEYKKAVEIEKETNVDAVHFDKNNDEEPEVIDSEATAEKKGGDDTVKTVEFESAQFSVYGIIGSYTVDFLWEVDGETYEFSLPGGGFVSLEHLVEELGIGTDDSDSEKEAEETAKKFMADVEKVEFSSPELVWVGKINEETTIGGLKEANGLEVDYSAALTQEQIEEINAQTVEAGDWALISMLPFDTEESLTVTMKTREVFTVRVTDAQISKLFISDKGENWKITVIYDEDARIPDGAELEVTEITPDDADYDSYLSRSRKELGFSEPKASEEGSEDTDADTTGLEVSAVRGEDRDAEDDASEKLTVSLPLVEGDVEQDISFVRFFDIRIVFEGRTVEPSAPVTVKVEYVEMPETEEGADVKAVHFAQNGVEVIDAEVRGNRREIVFEQSSFSVTGTVVTANQYWQPLGESGKYVMYAASGGKYYAIRHDRSLTEVTVADGKLTFEDITTLSDLDQYLWDLEAVNSGGWKHYLSYQTGGTTYYIDPQAANDISTTQRDLTRTGDNKIHSDNNYLGISGGNIVGRQSSQNGAEIQFANAFAVDVERYVTVHFVDRSGTPLTNVTYTGENPAVTQNADGTYKILYNWRGRTGDVNLNTDFTKSGYSYANSHLAGTRQDVALTYNGLVIDAKLTESGNTLRYYTDRGDNRMFGTLNDYDLNAALQVYNTNGSGTLVDYSPADADSKDIYVILDPIGSGSGGSGSGSGSGSGGSGSGSGSGSGGGNTDVDDPNFRKTMEPNGDGTYTISLNVTGKAKNQTTNPKANVVLVLDTSSSMDGSVTGGTRLEVMQKALTGDAASGVEGISKGLFENNGTHGRDDDTVEVAIVTFDGSVVTSNDWMKTQNEFDEKVDGLDQSSLHRGTDWEDALKEAYTLASNKMTEQPEEATFVIFFTDGEPSQYTQFHGAGDYNPGGSEGGYRRWYSHFLSREAAKDEARAIVNGGIKLYGIFAFNAGGEYAATGETGSKMLENTIGYAYNMDSVPEDTYFYNASNADTLNDSFQKILKAITESVGANNVHMHDDITTLTSVGISVLSGSDGNQYSGFRYTRSGGKYQAGQVWEDAPSAVFVETESTDPDHQERKEKYVEWDLGQSMLEDGVTYTVSFTVWPSQEAYNLVADLNNEIITWNALSEDQKNQVLENPAGSGKYELMTNPPSADGYNEITYDKVRTEILDPEDVPAGVVYGEDITEGNVTTVYTLNEDGTVTKTETTHTTTAFNDPEKNMKLEDTISKVMKKWIADLQRRQLVEYLYDTETGEPRQVEIPFVINRDTSVYGNPIMLGWDQEGPGTGYTWSDTTTEVQVGENTYTIGTEWTKRFDIAVGLILDRDHALQRGLDVDHDTVRYKKVIYQNKEYYLLEPGHDYFINEPVVAQLLGYRFDFSTRIYHPMLVNGILKSVTIEDGVVTDVYPGSTHALGAITGENTLRGGINLHKILWDTNGNPIPDSTQVDDEFSFTITLVNTDTITKTILGPEGTQETTTSNVFVGEDVPWYSVNGKYYHDSEGNYYNEDGDGRSGNIMQTEDGQTATVTLSIKRTDTVRVANVPAGTKFTIVETPRNDYDFVKATRGVTGTTQYNRTVYVPTINGNIVPNKEMNVAFTNKKVPKYKIDILKKNAANNLPLPDAVFDLYGSDYYVKDGQGQPTTTVNDEAVPIKQDLTSSNNGEIALGELISGTYYLVETDAPDGFQMTSPIKITVDRNSTVTKEVEGVTLPLYVTYHQDGNSGSDNHDGIAVSVSTEQTPDGEVTTYSYTLTVINNPGVALPNTGGPGTTMIYLLGLMLTAFAGAGLAISRRKRSA